MAKKIAGLLIAAVMLAGVETVFDCTTAQAQSQSTVAPPRAVIGVKLREPTPQEAQSLGLPAGQGALVDATVPNGPAEKAGLRPGDLILSVDRQTINYAAQAAHIIGGHNPGDILEIMLLRSGRQQMLKVMLAPPGDSASVAPTKPPPKPAPDPLAKATETAGSPGSAKIIRFRPFAIRDPQINNLEVLRLLVPEDWQVQGGVLWRHDRAILATAVLRVYNPKSSEAVHFLPIEQFAQANPGWGFGIGSIYLGSELQPAMDPQTFVARIVVPRYRQEIGGGTPVGGEELPTVAQAAQTPGMASQNRAGRFRYSYTLSGKPMEEDIYCVLNYTSAPAVQSVYWFPLQLYSVRAEKGQLDRQTKLMQVIASSPRLNLQWFNAYQQVWEMWKANVMQSIQNAGHLSRYIAGINNEISAMNRQAWNEHQASQDRISRRFSEYIRGVDTYRNPITNQPIQLPSGFNQAWTNPSGEYIVSDSPSYNPNIGSTRNWQAMLRVP
jgi:PDZ domain